MSVQQSTHDSSTGAQLRQHTKSTVIYLDDWCLESIEAKKITKKDLKMQV